MKNFAIYPLYAVLIGSSMGPAWAEDNEAVPATFSFQLSGLKWSQTKTKESDQPEARDATSLMTGDLVDAYVFATIGKLNVYFYPFQDVTSLVSVSYMVRDDLEVGVDLGLNAEKIKEPKSEVSSDLFGAFVTWILPIDTLSLENVAVMDFTRLESTQFNSLTEEEETNKVSGSFMKISSTIVVPISKNAFYMAGVWVAAERGKDHTSGFTKKASQFGVTLAGLRMTVD